MGKDKAKAFVQHLLDNPDLKDKMKGFTQEDLKEAVDEMVKDGKVQKDDELVCQVGF